MGIEIHFDGKPVTDGKAPYNDKFGDAGSLDDAIAKARAAHEKAGGKKEDVDNEGAVIVNNGDNLWAIWNEHAKSQGVSWEDFLQNNLHLKDPKTLDGSNQEGWKDWWLVHKGDVVFIPDGPSGAPEPATVSDGNNHGPIVKHDGTWQFEMKDEAGRPTYHKLAAEQTLTYDGVKYKIVKVEGDIVEVQPLKEDGTPDTAKPTEKLDLNKVSRQQATP